MRGECHLNFEKLLTNILSFQSLDDNKDFEFGKPLEVKFKENLYLFGHLIGEVKGLIRME